MENGKIKTIVFKMVLEGRGIVNYDGNDNNMKEFLNQRCGYGLDEKNNNFKFAKKTFIKKDNYDELDGKNDLEYKVKISSNLLRHDMFYGDSEMKTPKINLIPSMVCHYATSVEGLLRGFCILLENESTIKSSALSISEAIQTNNSMPHMDFFSNDVPKEKKIDRDEKSTSIFMTETIGNIEYETKGLIDLQRLQYISSDPYLGRMAIKPSWLEGNNPLFHNSMFKHYGHVFNINKEDFNYGDNDLYSLGYWSSSSETIGEYFGEQGILLKEKFVKYLVKQMIKRMLEYKTIRANAYCMTKKLSIKVPKDALDNFCETGEWFDVTPTTYEEVVDYLFDKYGMYIFYEMSDIELINRTLGEIKKIEESLKEQKKQKKEEDKLRREKKKKEQELLKDKES